MFVTRFKVTCNLRVFRPWGDEGERGRGAATNPAFPFFVCLCSRDTKRGEHASPKRERRSLDFTILSGFLFHYFRRLPAIPLAASGFDVGACFPDFSLAVGERNGSAAGRLCSVTRVHHHHTGNPHPRHRTGGLSLTGSLAHPLCHSTTHFTHSLLPSPLQEGQVRHAVL